MTLRIPCLDVEQNEIDRFQLLVREAIAVVSVRVERRVDSHRLCRGE